MLRSDRPAQQLIHSVEAVARDAFPNPAFLASRTAHDILADRIAGERLGAVLFSWYGATAVLLGLAGIYGLTSYLMARTWRELGVRSALGASTGTLVWMTISRALAPVVLGITVGIGLAVVASQVLTATVLGLEGADAVAYAASGGGFFVAALTVSIVAALPVWHLTPSDVLRSE